MIIKVNLYKYNMLVLTNNKMKKIESEIAFTYYELNFQRRITQFLRRYYIRSL